MKKIFDDFQAKYKSDDLKIRNIPFKDIFGDFLFYLIEESENNSSDFDQQIREKNSNSQSVFVDIYIPQEGQIYFIICIDQMLIIIKSQNLHLLKRYFSNQEMQEIYFFAHSEENFKKYINIQYQLANQKYSIFDNTDFININFDIDSNEFWPIIKKIMLIHIFSKGYAKTFKNRIDEYLQNAQTPNYTTFKEIDSSEIVLIDSTIQLAYYIQTQNLVFLKTIKKNDKIQQREIDSISKISHPIIPRFFGITNNEGRKSFVVEYVNGETLENCVKNFKITRDDDKFDVLMHIMVAIEYLHTKDYVYRNLDPANVIIDHNKMAVLIDFDRTTEYSRSSQNLYAAPEVHNNEYSFKSDVYSFGLMIYYILTSNEPRDENLNLDVIPENYSEVRNIIMKCTQKNIDDRPSFPDLFCDFYLFCKKNNLIRGFGKAIQYFMFAAEHQNDEIAQCHIGFIYLDPGFPYHDVEKGIHYLTLAANQNNLYSQNFLGFLYLNGNYVKPNIGKAIHFLSLAANQNQQDAQYILGCIYFEDLIGNYDIEKAIHYFKEVSSCNQNANNNLGVIYKTGKGGELDISKSIDYFKEAIKQKNDSVAKFNLAHIYFFEDESKQNISKSLKLLVEAAKEEVPHSLDFLCLVVVNKFNPLNEKEIEKEFEDIDKNSGESLVRRVFNRIKNDGFYKDQVYRQLKDINLVYYIHGIDVLNLK